MRRNFDLHLHSWYSYDAHLAPEEILSAAQEKGVETICVCNHHNMDGFAAMDAVSRRFPDVRWVPGMEVSVSTRLGNFDFVAAGLPLDAPERLRDIVDRYRAWMREFNRVLLEGFRLLDISFGEEEKEEMLRSWRPGPARDVQGEVRLPNNGVKPWLLEHGVIGDAGEFAPLVQRALKEAGGEPPYPAASEVLPRFRELGAVIIVAHPRYTLEREGADAFDSLVEETGLAGIEAGHTSHSPEQFARYVEFARERDLYISGGTDIHFPRDLDTMGRHLCPESLAEPLLERLRQVSR